MEQTLTARMGSLKGSCRRRWSAADGRSTDANRLDASFGNALQNPRERAEWSFAEQHEPHQFGSLCAEHELTDGVQCQFRRLIDRKTERTGAEGGEGDRSAIVLDGEPQAFVMNRRQQAAFSLLAAAPNRADGMEHELSRELASAGDDGRPGRTPLRVEPLRLVLEDWPPLAMDRTVHASADLQLGIRGVDQRIDRLPGDVPLHQFHQTLANLKLHVADARTHNRTQSVGTIEPRRA